MGLYYKKSESPEKSVLKESPCKKSGSISSMDSSPHHFKNMLLKQKGVRTKQASPSKSQFSK
jgi:hypothetical protein